MLLTGTFHNEPCSVIPLPPKCKVWKSVFGIRDLTKIHYVIWENAKCLDGKRNLPKFGHGMRDFACLLGRFGLFKL